MNPESVTCCENDLAISVADVYKTYRLYPSHQDRLKEALHPFRKRYHQEFSALSGISFDIRKGESVGILGRNGAGKSTLLQLIAGVLSPTSGTINVKGRVAALLELGAGFNPDLTGRENVILASTIQGIAEEAIPDRVAAVEEFADVGVFFDQPMKVYSSGMYARVAFANAINVNPDILIVDEILGVGDAKFQEKCYNKIHSLKKAGVCILFVSHSTEVIQRNCNRAILLEGGRLLKYGLTTGIVAAYHDLLYGAKKITEFKIASTSQTSVESTPPKEFQNDIGDGELTAFLNGLSKVNYRDQPYYNSHERHFGNGEAEILDLLVLVDNEPQFSALTGGEILDIYIKVKYKRQVDFPQIGWGLTTPEGIVIAGSNTVMQDIRLRSVAENEIVVYAQELKLALCGGQYFVNIAIGEYLNQEWIYFDVRRSIIHLAVADLGRGSGFFYIPSKFKEISARRTELT